MNSGEILYRATYEGKRVKNKRTVRTSGKTEGESALLRRTAMCAVIAVLLWAAGTYVPQIRDSAKRFLGESIDYTAVFSAVGEAVSGEGEFVEVWNTLTGNDGDAVEVYAPALKKQITAPVKVLKAAEEYSETEAAELNESVRIESAGVGLSPPAEYSEQLLPFPAGESDGEEDAPETVSYDYLLLEFDYADPLEGKMTSGFGYRIHPISKRLSFHYGIDIGAAMGSKITSFADGTVELVDYDSIYGNYVFVRHCDGIISFYGHCKSVDVTEGQLVRMGETIARVGSTGLSTGPHLHFEVRSGDTVLDPTHYVNVAKN